MKMGYHLVGKRDFGLRPLAGAQGHVTARDLRVGALARGHGSSFASDARASRAASGCATLVVATRSQLAGCAPLALQNWRVASLHMSSHVYLPEACWRAS